jgi:ribosomal protein L12E/L44/L45/RPP1/RPP2
MHLKVFDKLSLGNLKEKRKKDPPAEIDERAREFVEDEAGAHGKNKHKGKADKHAQNTDEAIALPTDVTPIRPHGPAAELTLDEEEPQETAGITLDEVEINDSTKLGEEVKIKEVTTAKPAAAPPAAPASAAASIAVAMTAAAPAAENKTENKEETKEEKSQDADSLNNLFNTEEEEENPLASLINSLPDVSIREIMDDLAEIQRIIKEWRPSAK